MEIETEEVPCSSSGDGQQKSNRLGLCEVCQVKDAKYTCPRCEVKTCGLQCNKIHKKELECDGSRDKTKYIPLNKFTNMDLSSDYQLLEEITRNVQVYKKDKLKRYTRINRDLPHHLSKLRKAAALRKTTLKFLPPHFARHKNNTSQVNFKSNIIYWHIDWVFINAGNLLLKDERVCETERLSKLINKYLVKQEDPVVQERLQYYHAAGISGVKLFLKAEEKSGCKFYELDPDLNLKDNLSNKTLIEHPIIHVVLQYHADCYDIICSDDEDSNTNVVAKKRKTGYQVVVDIVKKAEKEDNLYKSIKNMLFISEYSDEELSDD